MYRLFTHLDQDLPILNVPDEFINSKGCCFLSWMQNPIMEINTLSFQSTEK